MNPKFKEVNQAYEVLSDPQKRASYDQFGQAGFEQQQGNGPSGFDSSQFGGFDFGGAGDFDFGNIFDMFFGRERNAQRGPMRGNDIEAQVEIDFRDAVFGKTIDLNVQRQEKCLHCRGNGAEPGTKIVTCPTCQGNGKLSKNNKHFLVSFRVW